MQWFSFSFEQSSSFLETRGVWGDSSLSFLFLLKTATQHNMDLQRIPTSVPAQRIAILFHRRLDTPWSEKEIRQFRQLVKDGAFSTLNDLQLIEAYYVFERRKDNGIYRRELYTFLNNYLGELDKAREWAGKREVKAQTKTSKFIQFVPDTRTPEEIEKTRLLVAAEVEKLRLKLQAPQYERESA